MEGIDTMTVAEVVSANIKTADIFKKKGIDFCCGGNVSVKEVCEKKGISFEKLKSDIQKIETKVDHQHDFNSWDLDILSDYIINNHHKYIEEATPLIKEYASKVAKVHGHHYSEVVEINHLFGELADELIAHMKKEEIILFPFVKNLAESKREGLKIEMPVFGSIKNPIQMMELDHSSAGDNLKKISELSNEFTPPEDACNTFKALYAKLQEFQDDLFEHIHLENNILFPKAIKLEEQLID